MLSDYLGSRQTQALPILIVEDDPDHQQVIAYSLKTKIPRAQPIFAATPDEAQIYLQRSQSKSDSFPRLVLLDLLMPDLETGWQLLTELREWYPRLPIVILSGYAEEDIIKKAYELGANSFLAKPSQYETWQHCFQVLNQYWFETITLPPAR